MNTHENYACFKESHLQTLDMLRERLYRAKEKLKVGRKEKDEEWHDYTIASAEKELNSHLKFLKENYGYEETTICAVSDDELLDLLEA